MKVRKKRKLLYKFLLFVLPFLILTIIITSAVLSWTSYTYFQKTIVKNYSNILKSSAGEIRLYMQNAQKHMEELAVVISATKLDQWQKDMALTAFNHISTEIRRSNHKKPNRQSVNRFKFSNNYKPNND